MAIIPVPKPPKQAYNPRRPPGTLLQNQLKHLEWAIRPAAERSPKKFRIKAAKTEAEAARRIEKLTRELHRQATAPKPPQASQTSKPIPTRQRRARVTARSKTHRRTAR